MSRKSILLVTHFFGWLLGLGFVLSFILSGSLGNKSFSGIFLSWPFWIFVAFYLLVFYLNELLLMPHLFIRKQYFLYVSALLALIVFTFYLKPFDLVLNANRTEPTFSYQDAERRPPPPGDVRNPAGVLQKEPPLREGHFDLVSIILFLCVWAISTILVISKQWRITSGNHEAARAAKANAELSFLKAQISPHFLFNTLNNIYSLAINKSDATPDGILRLSNIMRYVTDEASKDFVSLQQELDCINDFIALQRLRLSKNIQLLYQLRGNTGKVFIAPLMLMPFIENVFKHGIDNGQLTTLHILISVEANKIKLFTSNPLVGNEVNTGRPGVGLQNVKQRLELIYSNRYKLVMKEEGGDFIVNLEIKSIE